MSTCIRSAASVLLALGLISTAHAGDELYLRWDNCLGDGGIHNKAFACNTNSSEDFLVGSLRLGQTTEQVTGLEIVVHITALDPTLPSWWQYQLGGAGGAPSA